MPEQKGLTEGMIKALEKGIAEANASGQLSDRELIMINRAKKKKKKDTSMIKAVEGVKGQISDREQALLEAEQ